MMVDSLKWHFIFFYIYKNLNKPSHSKNGNQKNSFHNILHNMILPLGIVRSYTYPLRIIQGKKYSLVELFNFFDLSVLRKSLSYMLTISWKYI